MSNLEEQSGMLLGQSEGLTKEQQALIHAFVGMVKRVEVPTTQGGNETNQGARGNSTEANDPMETNEGEDDENGSLKVELLQLRPLVWNLPRSLLLHHLGSLAS
jgi:hypothetical protein